MGERQANDPQAMPLDVFIAEVMQILSLCDFSVSVFSVSAFGDRTRSASPPKPARSNTRSFSSSSTTGCTGKEVAACQPNGSCGS
jgi:hypothetical protein